MHFSLGRSARTYSELADHPAIRDLVIEHDRIARAEIRRRRQSQPRVT